MRLKDYETLEDWMKEVAKQYTEGNITISAVKFLMACERLVELNKHERAKRRKWNIKKLRKNINGED